MGICSYWLVSFWFTRDSAASAGKKAFVYNRLGDVGFLLAVFLVFEQDPLARVHGHLRQPVDRIGRRDMDRHLPAAASSAVVGKSAQIPLFPWLADAMEGPTPVSALIHAATMVTAGVYLHVPDQPAAPRLELTPPS